MKSLNASSGVYNWKTYFYSHIVSWAIKMKLMMIIRGKSKATASSFCIHTRDEKSPYNHNLSFWHCSCHYCSAHSSDFIIIMMMIFCEQRLLWDIFSSYTWHIALIFHATVIIYVNLYCRYEKSFHFTPPFFIYDENFESFLLKRVRQSESTLLWWWEKVFILLLRVVSQ